jgi:hypothetical protein
MVSGRLCVHSSTGRIVLWLVQGRVLFFRIRIRTLSSLSYLRNLQCNLRILFIFYRTGFNLNQERIQVCKHEVVVKETYSSFNHNNKQILLSLFLTFVWRCIMTNFFIINELDALISQIYFGRKIYMFRTVPQFIIRTFLLYTQQWCMSYQFADSLQAVYKPVWHIPLLCVQ